MSNSPPDRWLIVVPRDQPELYRRLRASLKAEAPFTVLLERREGDRRRGSGDRPESERRRSDRRQQKAAGLVYVAALTREEPTPDLPAAAAAMSRHPTVVTAACPACFTALTFELPRFPRPPARLDAEVVHIAGVGAPQHYAEIQAFTVSGRPLLIGRVQALRRQVTPGG